MNSETPAAVQKIMRAADFVKVNYVTKRWGKQVASSLAQYVLFDVNKKAQG